MKQLFLSFLFLTFILHLTAQTPAAGQYLFILDGSGSMWQKLGEENKIAIAKTVMKNLVQSLPAEAQAGLVAYGHNRKSDCADIETLVPLARLDKAAFSAKLDAINPQGKTPIAQSIAHALAVVKTSSAPVTVILVSDGLETCDGNACDLVKQARKQGVRITLHVVGFGIEEQDLSPLECIAQAGGGRYFPANNADELTGALEQSVEEPVKNGGFLSVKVTLDGNPVDATVKVFKKGETKETALGRTYTGAETNPRVLLLPKGDYVAEINAITLDGRPLQRLADLVIAPNDTLHRTVDFAKGTFEILVTRNAALSDAVVILYRSGTKEVAAQTRSYKDAKNNPVKFQVLPGLYDVSISSVEIEGKPEVRIEKQLLAGAATVSLSHAYQSGELKIGARQDSSPVDATVGIYSKKTGANVANGRTYQTAASNPKTFILEPGEYEVRLNAVKPAGLGKKTLTAVVTAKGTTEVTGTW
ncbi:MAG: VWA domain-containing protein [Saprospiraceae bacterium]|jgi:Ca-activated chloride channel family protein|nr:VWA domain-containing protein [Saprospiraceae bacterium]